MTNTPPAEEDRGEADDSEVMRIWRECGLPGYFLGNGGSNHKLVAFAKACALLSSPRVEGDARLFIENVAACSEDDRVGVLRVLAERILATGSLSPQGE